MLREREITQQTLCSIKSNYIALTKPVLNIQVGEKYIICTSDSEIYAWTLSYVFRFSYQNFYAFLLSTIHSMSNSSTLTW